MTPAARSVRAFAIYLLLLSVGLLIAPNTLLRTFTLPPTTEVWIRVVGMLTAFLSVYYWTAATAECVAFLRATVLVRATMPLFLLVFVAGGWVAWPLLLFGVVDLVGAGWTWRALQSPAPNA